jgi:hypothetical protein
MPKVRDRKTTAAAATKGVPLAHRKPQSTGSQPAAASAASGGSGNSLLPSLAGQASAAPPVPSGQISFSDDTTLAIVAATVQQLQAQGLMVQSAVQSSETSASPSAVSSVGSPPVVPAVISTSAPELSSTITSSPGFPLPARPSSDGLLLLSQDSLPSSSLSALLGEYVAQYLSGNNLANLVLPLGLPS